MALSLLQAVVASKISLSELKILYHIRRCTEKARLWDHHTALRLAIIEEAATASGSTPEKVLGLLDCWTDHLQPQILSGLTDPALRSLLTRLRLRGYQLGVYSDYSARRKLEALALPPTLFDVIVESLSPEIDKLKPHPKGFHEVCIRMGLKPAAVIYLGDRLETDGAGARLAGMPFVHCKSSYLFAKRAPVTKYLLQWEKDAPTLKEPSSILESSVGRQGVDRES